MIPLVWNWLRKNVSLVLLLTATICLALAVGGIMRGSTWSLLVPVSLVAVVSGWGVGASRLSSKQAWVRLIALGIPGVFVFVGGLIPPLGRLILSLSALIPQFFAWLSTRLPIDTGSLLVAWSELIGHVASLFIRLWDWWWALLTGGPLVDPLAAGLMWSVLLWLVGAWAGWHLRRNYQALRALAPGGVIMAVVLDTRHEDVGILIVYLAALLALIGLSRVNWMHLRWRQQQVSYSDSVRLETLGMVGVVTIALVLSAAGAPSLSWRE
jgi:hypothetical protein